MQSLLARRDFLLSDVDHLEQYLKAQRERLRDAAVQLQELVDRVPGGLADMRRPLLSASNEPPASPLSDSSSSPGDAADPGEVAIPGPDPSDSTADIDNVDVVQTQNADAEREVITDQDMSPLFTQKPGRAEGLSALAMSGDTEAQDSVWRLLDEEVAGTQAAQASLELGDATAEVPVTAAAVDQSGPFEVGGDELR